MGSIVLSLAWVESASGQPAQPPDLSGGEGGWVHPRGTGFQPVPGSPSPVRQDPGHPYTPGRGTAHRIGDLSNPYMLRNDVRLEDYVCGEPHRDINMIPGIREARRANTAAGR